MAKFASTAVLDAPLDLIATATELYYCAGQPATRAAAISSAAAPAITMAPGDFVKSGTTNRILTVGAKSTTATAAVTVDHVALCTASALLYVTTAPSQASTISGTVGSSVFTITDPAVV